ncbi:DUF1772 domain-containing protein [Cupriavidus oxalaticus]|uniref:anthrone oxygenase family protein n=1 Tax=Cupriavidus oxalaticus TaxID=96344 RepID=UPI003F73D00C
MFQILQVLSVVLVAIGMGLSLAHALELPGKLRLNKDTYLGVQTIYYPGFTIGGMFGEVGAMLATLMLTLVTPFASTGFWLTLAAFLCLLAAHGVFWIWIQPVNKVWLKGQKLHGAGAAFFGSTDAGQTSIDRDWTSLRDRWEYSHVARAVLAMLGLVLLATAVTD